MSSSNDTTSPLTANRTTMGQPNLPCGLHVPHSTAERISFISLYCVNLLGSFLGNIFILIIVYKHRDLRKTINYFIVNMAVSDLLFPLIVIPVNIVELVTESWQWRVREIFGSIVCHLFHFSGTMTLHVSTQSLVWIAIDRFVAVVFPVKLGLISPKIRKTAIVSTWIVAGLFNLPSMIISGVTVHENNKAHCSSTAHFLHNPDFSTTVLIAQLSVLSIAPLVVITVLYTAIAIALKRQNRALNDTVQNIPRHSEKKRRQAIRMAVIIVVLFYICVIPSTLLYVAPHWSLSCASQKVFLSLTSLAFSLSSMVNPIVCLSLVESYRRGLRNILCPCTKTPAYNPKAKPEQVTLKEVKTLPTKTFHELRRTQRTTKTH